MNIVATFVAGTYNMPSVDGSNTDTMIQNGTGGRAHLALEPDRANHVLASWCSIGGRYE